MSFLSKIGKGLSNVGKGIAGALSGGLKAVAATGLVPGIGGKALGFVGNLLAPKKNNPAPVQKTVVSGSGSSGSGSLLSKIVSGVTSGTRNVSSVNLNFVPKSSQPAMPVYQAPLTQLQKTVFAPMPVMPAQPSGGGQTVDLGGGFGFNLPSMGNSSNEVDKNSSGSVPVWVWVVGGFGTLITLILLIFGLKRKR